MPEPIPTPELLDHADHLINADRLQRIRDTLRAYDNRPNPHAVTVLADKLWRILDDPAPVPGSSRRAPEPAFGDVGKCPQCGQQSRSYSSGCSWCGETEPAGESQASEPARRLLSPASAVAVEVIAELARAEAKFPDQHLPDGTGGPVAQAIGALLKAMCQANGPGEDTWMAVVAEEVGESFAETEWALLRPELVQVAAMAVRWVLDGDSRSAVTA